MNTQIGVIVVKDKRGQVAVGASQDPDSPVRVRGLTGANGQPVYYHDAAGGVERWAVHNGLEFEQHILDLDLANRTVLGWNFQPK